MAVDLNEQLNAGMALIATEGVAGNQRLAQHTLLAFQKDLFQGGQGETGMIAAAMALGDRTPVIKAA